MMKKNPTSQVPQQTVDDWLKKGQDEFWYSIYYLAA
jgi:hypothetical protein